MWSGLSWGPSPALSVSSCPPHQSESGHSRLWKSGPHVAPCTNSGGSEKCQTFPEMCTRQLASCQILHQLCEFLRHLVRVAYRLHCRGLIWRNWNNILHLLYYVLICPWLKYWGCLVKYKPFKGHTLVVESLEGFHGKIFYWTSGSYYWKKYVLTLFLMLYSKIQSLVIHFNYISVKTKP